MPICKELVKCGFVSYNSGLTDTLELLNLPEPPDAILAAHALLATSCIQTVQSRGIRVPDDVSIIGFMSDWVSDLATPRMSFIRQNVKEIGKKVFKALYDQINGDDIAFLGGPNELKQTIDRKHGYLQALRDRQMPICKQGEHS